MHYHPKSFLRAGAAGASWTKPAVKETKLNDDELREALVSKGSFASLARRLRSEGRI
jgi:hypothetical protein